MSQLTVDKVPEDAMVEVFKWLDPKSLKNAVLTCQQWKGFIERNIPWKLRKLKYEKHRGQEEWFELVLSSNRKFRNVTIDGLIWTRGSTGLDANTLGIFGKHGDHIRELTLANSPLISASMWCQLLTTMPQLEKLTMLEVTALVIKEDFDNIAQMPKLKKLKTVEMINSSCDLLTYIESCKLKTLNIVRFLCFQPIPVLRREPLLNFLATQEGLAELRFDVPSEGGASELFESPIPVDCIPFRLKKLSLVVSIEHVSQNRCDNLLAFVKLHKETLEDLELQDQFPSVIKLIFTEFIQLKTLRLSGWSLPQDSSFYDRLAVNTSVTSLYIRDIDDSDERAVIALFNHLPNIEKLKIYWISGPFAALIARTLKKLKAIKVNHFYGQEYDGLKFHALESLSIGKLHGPNKWSAFTKNNPGIKELSIETVDEPEFLDLKAITQNLKELRKLTVKDNKLSCDGKFFRMIRKNCKELKCLELNVKSLKVDIASVADIPGLRFRKY